jgi:hypothetical protein
VYLQNKLGGEISLSRTERSPELSFDVTMVDLILRDGLPTIKRFGILEIQTMDFHGSYRAAVKNLEDALRLHGDAFHATLLSNQRWLRDGIEGPNIANSLQTDVLPDDAEIPDWRIRHLLRVHSGPASVGLGKLATAPWPAGSGPGRNRSVRSEGTW